MTQEELVKEVCFCEEEAGCHDVKIEGISIYHFIRREIRRLYLIQHDAVFVERMEKGTPKGRMFSGLKSILHLITMPSKAPILFRTFRLENVNGVWLDRFSDPIIDECELSDYIIFETNSGRCQKPRCHDDHVYYDDVFSAVAKFKSILFSHYFKKKYKEEFESLYNAISTFIPANKIDRKFCYDRIITSIYRVKLYQKFLSRKKTKIVFGASRSSFMPLTCAANMLGIKVYELQHGIVYGDTITYSGLSDPLFTPTKFLMFGDVNPKDVYGISVDKMINIGWALKNYVNRLSLNNKLSDNNVLVLSQPGSTDYIIETVLYLAEKATDIKFHLRCHPMEVLSEEQQRLLNKFENICVQDNKMGFVVGVMPFNKVIGVQSTAIYESLSYGKETGLLTMNGRLGKFLQEDDKDCFWLIDDYDSFRKFINGENKDRKKISIYSLFDKESLNKLMS